MTAPRRDGGDQTTTVIEPTRGWRAVQLHELWAHRDLVYFFAWRDIKVRYKQTALGVLWAVIQPLVTLVLFGVVFRDVAGVDAPGGSYAAFAVAGLVPWTFVANGFSQAAQSLVNNGHLLGKIYFPRLVLPIGTLLGCGVDLAISLSIASVLLAVSGVRVGPHLVLLPLAAVLAALTALGLGLWLASLNVAYRDVRHAVPFLVQALLFATPIAYPVGLTHGLARSALVVNPVTAVVEAFRWCLLGQSTLPRSSFLVSVGVSVLLVVSGTAYFRRMERTFADVV